MKDAAADEAKTIKFYRRMAKRAPNRALGHSINCIIEDEVEHQRFFESVLACRDVKDRCGQGDRLKDMKYVKKQIDGRTIRVPELPEPYPPIKVECPNLDYARLLLDDYAGITSEMTAIHQYLFHHNNMPKEFAEVAELLEGVAVAEMLHLEILAELIGLLGQPPVYMDGHGQFWNAGCVPYAIGQPCEQLRINIESERTAIRNYRHHMEMINDRYIKAVLARIIKDEELHLSLFNKAYRRYCRCHES